MIRKNFLKKIGINVLLFTFFLFFPNKDFVQAQAPPEIPTDIFIAATVQPWLYFEVSPLTLNLSPDLVSQEGVFNIGETPDVIFKVGTSNPGGWEIKIKGKNNGLKSLNTNYTISSVNGTSTLMAGREGYGAQAISILTGVLINSIYDYYGTDIVGEIIEDYRSLASRFSSNALTEVVKMKIKASASITTPSDIEYSDIIILTIIPIV